MSKEPAATHEPSPSSEGTTLALKETVRAHYPHANREVVDAALNALEQAGEPSRQPLVARLLHAVGSLARVADESVAEAALGRASDFGLLVELLNAPSVAAHVREDDPLAPARLRWLRDRELLLSAEGGAVPAATIMDVTGLKSRQAVQQRRARGTLLGLPVGDASYLYPIWQFDPQGKTLPGIAQTIAALGRLDPWGQAAFLLSGEPRLDGWRPLDALRQGRVAEVVEAARAYGEQGGG